MPNNNTRWTLCYEENLKSLARSWSRIKRTSSALKANQKWAGKRLQGKRSGRCRLSRLSMPVWGYVVIKRAFRTYRSHTSDRSYDYHITENVALLTYTTSRDGRPRNQQGSWMFPTCSRQHQSRVYSYTLLKLASATITNENGTTVTIYHSCWQKSTLGSHWRTQVRTIDEMDERTLTTTPKAAGRSENKGNPWQCRETRKGLCTYHCKPWGGVQIGWDLRTQTIQSVGHLIPSHSPEVGTFVFDWEAPGFNLQIVLQNVFLRFGLDVTRSGRM